MSTPLRVVVVGVGVAGSEAGTYLGTHAQVPLEVIEIEAEPSRRHGGWGFQKFPDTETTNLALRKMYLGEDPQEILRWAKNEQARSFWPEKFRDMVLDRDETFPRALMQEYVKWRRRQVQNELVTYNKITGEAMKVALRSDGGATVHLKAGEVLDADIVTMASGSISVKVPEYLRHLANHDNVIIDPLTEEGHGRRAEIPKNARVLVLGTGLTGEEQVNVLIKYGHTNLSLLSRGGKRHYPYPKKQENMPLVIDTPPDFLHAETPEEFNYRLTEFYDGFLGAGHSQEDILQAIRPYWDQMRANLGGCVKAAGRLRDFRRELAVNSIGAPWELSKNLSRAESDGRLTVARGHITRIDAEGDGFKVHYSESADTPATHTETYDVIINAVGRNIIRHPIWDNLLADGLADKHAGIGVKVSDTGQMINAQGDASDVLWVVGMARAGDHALRHGFLGNTAFNVPQVRSHLYGTMSAMLEKIHAASSLMKSM